MPQIMLPHGDYSLHHGPMDMSHNRIAARFGVRGLDGVEDARGPSRVLPLVRGNDGWFYLTDGQRAQVRRLRGLGDASADYLAQAAKYVPGSADYQFLTGCAANPTAPACAAEVGSVLSAPFVTAAQTQQFNQAIASGAVAPVFNTQANVMSPTAAQLNPSGTTTVVTDQGSTGVVTGGGVMTPQEQASATTGKPNQSVPPSTPLTPLPTGTGADGGNPFVDTGNTSQPGAGGSGGLLLIAAAVGLLLLMK